MNSKIELLTKTRENLLDLISGMSIEELNKIPSNFNNNAIWHLGHIIVTQQLLTYQLSGLKLKIDMGQFAKYKKGTKPEEFIGEEEYRHLKAVALPLIHDFAEDYGKGMFVNYNVYATSYGVELANIEDALQFNALHEGLHLGYVMALKRAAAGS